MRINIDDIINSFVDFYGEDRREEITTKLKNILFLKIDNLSSLKSKEIENKYYNLLKNEFNNLFPDNNPEIIKSFLGSTIDNKGHCFDNKSEELLNNPETSPYEKHTIKVARATFLKENGFRLYDKNGKLINYPQYELFLQDKKCLDFIKKIRPICEQISKRKEELYQLQTIDIIKNSDNYQYNKQELEKRNYLDHIIIDLSFYLNPISCFCPNFIIENNNIVFSPIVLINSKSSDDNTIIHEINHVLEYHILEVNNKGVKSHSGWNYEEEMFNQEKEDINYSNNKRKYELMNEYINEMISEEITNIFHNQGHSIINTKENYQADYLIIGILLKDFYNLYKTDIINSRKSGWLDYMYEVVGKDNFEELNNLVNSFYKIFNNNYLNALVAINEYRNSKDTKEAKIIEELINKKDEILSQMQEYSLNKESSKISL